MAIMDWIEEHPIVLIAGGIAIVLFVVPKVLKLGQTSNGTTPTNSMLGSSNDAGTGTSYIPTQTIFTTVNKYTGSNVNSPNSATSSVSAPSATTVTAPSANSTTVTVPVSVTSNTPVTVNTPPRMGTPAPNPPTGGHLQWDQNYTIHSGDTLTGVAAKLTSSLRSSGMPGNVSVTYADIFAHNTAIITTTAAKHGIKSGFANWIYPGEIITVPRWIRS